MANRPLTAIDADLAHYTAQAARLPVTHPDHATVHAILSQLLTEREQAQPLRPSQVLARH